MNAAAKRARAWLVAIGAAGAIVLAAGCGEKASPVAPRTNTPPAVVSLFPLPRATLVPYFTQIYAQFDHALDPGTVDTTTVFLKVDTRRLPVRVEYIRTVNRIQITPRAELELNRTYTVEILGRLKTADGDSLGQKLVWQFTTNSLRRMYAVTPAPGALEGPHTLLSWGGNGGAQNSIVYDVYAATDSAAVRNRTVPMLQSGVYVNCLPRQSWPAGATVYWSVSAHHLATGERLEGPVSSFRVYPADTPIDSVEILLQEYGGVGQGSSLQYCTQNTLRTGATFNSSIRWALNGDRPDLRVADARILMMANPQSASSTGLSATQFWYAQNTWASCFMSATGAPFTELNGYLATGVPQGLQVTFRSPALAAFVEAAGRYGGWHGLLLRGPQGTTIWDVNSFTVPRPSMMVYFYRPPTPSTDAR
ncbi:MAG: Ig-like domain-containing protein [Candidatus Eisenbacteria bacterium]|nr:Ig-like domain-containing protein [Candidatus Eisenbacteria bacterium]